MVKVTFRTMEGMEASVDARAGETLMAAAVRNRLPGIEAACGGSMVCGTCHVYVSEPWFSQLTPASELEMEMHEYGVLVEPNSRLACQITLTPALDGLIATTPLSQR